MGVTTPYSMRNQKDLVIAVLEIFYEFEDGEIEKEKHRILFWGDYGYVCPSLMTTNGSLSEICKYLQAMEVRANHHNKIYSSIAGRMFWTLSVRTNDGFVGFDPTVETVEALYEKLKSIPIPTLEQ